MFHSFLEEAHTHTHSPNGTRTLTHSHTRKQQHTRLSKNVLPENSKQQENFFNTLRAFSWGQNFWLDPLISCRCCCFCYCCCCSCGCNSNAQWEFRSQILLATSKNAHSKDNAIKTIQVIASIVRIFFTQCTSVHVNSFSNLVNWGSKFVCDCIRCICVLNLNLSPFCHSSSSLTKLKSHERPPNMNWKMESTVWSPFSTQLSLHRLIGRLHRMRFCRQGFECGCSFCCSNARRRRKLGHARQNVESQNVYQNKDRSTFWVFKPQSGLSTPTLCSLSLCNYHHIFISVLSHTRQFLSSIVILYCTSVLKGTISTLMKFTCTGSIIN